MNHIFIKLILIKEQITDQMQEKLRKSNLRHKKIKKQEKWNNVRIYEMFLTPSTVEW